MTNRVQTQRLLVTDTIPAPYTRDAGELWLNFPDFQFGFIDEAKVAQKLIPIRYFVPSATYHTGDMVVEGGSIWTANGPVAPGPWNPSQWTQIQGGGGGTGGGGAYLPLAGGTMLGSLILAHNPSVALEAATKGYIDTLLGLGSGGSGGPYLPLSGGTMGGPIVLSGLPTLPAQAASKAYVDSAVAAGGGGGGGAAYVLKAGDTMTGPLILSGAPSAANGAATKAYVDANSGGVAGNCPTGGMMDFAGLTAPAGWLLCNGAIYPISSYPVLAGVIGNRYGGDGTTTFAVPNIMDRVTVGQGLAYALGNTGGAKTVTLSVAQLASHKHTDTTGHQHNVYQDQHRHALVNNVTAVGVVARVAPIPSFQLIDDAGPTAGPIDFTGVLTDYQTPTVNCGLGYSSIDNTGQSQPHENMPPYFAATKIIKT